MSRRKLFLSFGLLLFGNVFIIAGLLLVYFWGSDVNFACQRSSDICVIEEKDVFNNVEIKETFNLRKFAGAEVIESKDSNGKYLYKLVLIVNRDRILLSDYFSTLYNSHKVDVQIINDYVKSSQEDLEILQSGKVFRITGFVVAGLGCLLLLVTLILFAKPLFKRS